MKQAVQATAKTQGRTQDTLVRRKPRSGGRQNKTLKRMLLGFLAALSTTVLGVVLFALLLRAWQADAQTITVINQVLKLVAILAGVWVAVGRGGEKGALRGALIGLAYMGLGVALYGLLSGQQLSLAGYAADVGMGIAAGGLCGMILSNLPAK